MHFTTDTDLDEEAQLILVESLQGFVTELDINKALQADDIQLFIKNKGINISDLEVLLLTPEKAQITLYPSPIDSQNNASIATTYQLAQQEFIRLKQESPLVITRSEVNNG